MRYLIGIGLFCAGFGAGFVAWVWRSSVALELTAPSLAEFVKFLAGVRTLQIQIERLNFLWPLFVIMLAIPFFAENQQLKFLAPIRYTLRLFVIPLALASLSPVWAPDVLLSAEFRTQTILAITAITLSLIAPFIKLKFIPLKILAISFSLLSFYAIFSAYQEFNLIHAELEEIYHEPIRLGIGWYMTVVGLILGSFGAIGDEIKNHKTQL